MTSACTKTTKLQREGANMNTKQFVARHNIRMDAEYADHNPNMSDEWARTATHWKCTFHYGRRRLTTYFSQGAAISGEPTAADVLDCLASDANGADQDFEAWCKDYGYDADSRKHHATFKVIQKQTRKLERLLGPELFEQLLYKTERL